MASIIEDQLSWALCHISVLEEMLAERDDTITRMTEGDTTEWDP